MNRNLSSEAIVLHTTKMGDMHRRVALLSPQLGLIWAAAFGARKGSGSLAGAVQPFYGGTFYLYHNPQKDQYKIEDARISSYREYLIGDLSSMYVASLFCELIIATGSSGGEYEESYQLLVAILDGLEDEKRRNYIIVHGIWRFLYLMGLLPDVEACSHCLGPLNGQRAILDPDAQGFVHPGCTNRHDLPALEIAELDYLRYTSPMDLTEAIQVRIARDAGMNIKRLLLYLLDQATEGRLKTLRSGML